MADPGPRPVANVRDLPAFAGVLLAATALAMPWYRRRSCPIFEECGPWRDVSGWESFGLVALVGLSSALLLAVVVREPTLRRVLPAIACFLVGVVQGIFHEGFSFVIFGDQEGPLAGFWLFAAGLAVAVVGWLASASFLPASRQARS
jgi:hypothetical protein